MGNAPADFSGDHRLANSVGLGSVTLACRLVQPRRNVNSSAARLRPLRTTLVTARSAGRSVVASPTASECQAPHSQASTLTPLNPAQAPANSAPNHPPP